MKREAAAISFIDDCILWLVSIVYDTVLAILYISVDLYVIIGGIPSVQFVLSRCRPEDRTVETTAVSEAVWKSAVTGSPGMFLDLEYYSDESVLFQYSGRIEGSCKN